MSICLLLLATPHGACADLVLTYPNAKATHTDLPQCTCDTLTCHMGGPSAILVTSQLHISSPVRLHD